jgi:hypothetical protein
MDLCTRVGVYRSFPHPQSARTALWYYPNSTNKYGQRFAARPVISWYDGAARTRLPPGPSSIGVPVHHSSVQCACAARTRKG